MGSGGQALCSVLEVNLGRFIFDPGSPTAAVLGVVQAGPSGGVHVEREGPTLAQGTWRSCKHDYGMPCPPSFP